MDDTHKPLRVRVFADPAGGHELRLQLDHPSESGLRRGVCPAYQPTGSFPPRIKKGR